MITANQAWKKSGTTLSFKDYLNREKAKQQVGADGSAQVILNKSLNDAVQNSLNSVKTDAGYQTQVTNKTFFGINKTVLIISIAVIGAAVIYKVYKNKQK